MKVKKYLPARLGGWGRNVYNKSIGRLYRAKDLKPLRDFMDRRYYCPKNRKPLWDFVEKTKPRRILEIGLGIGDNAKKMMKLANNCKYHCFDNLYRKESKEAYEDLKDKDNVSFIIGDTKKTLPAHVEDLPKMDLIFIDGGHDYETVKNDWENCRKLMHRDTACFFHDYNLPHVKRAVSEIGERYSKKIIKPPSSPPDFALVMKDRK